ncbi:MAG: anthranilate synthase component I family protein, partial [Candidatus Omnitrophica bacterium]|nr:anthranilate synthase component I family protein [Candidatus Omnitrophota bacterium]
MKFPIVGILKLLEKEKNCVFLETAKQDQDNFLSYLFLRPKKIISTFQIDEIENCFAELDQALKQGHYVAGFLSYQAGFAFEQSLKYKERYDFPLLWFGVYQEPLIYNHRKDAFENHPGLGRELIEKITFAQETKLKNYSLEKIRPSISPPAYSKAIAKIKTLIAQGLTYQVNYTFKLNFNFSGSPSKLYLNLRANQNVSYSALLKTEHFDILSFSPELFFRKQGKRLCVRPMKGTAQRGRSLEEDQAKAGELAGCLKNRSENIMIVDLLRNDLGRISKPGSVRVPELFNVEKYQTLLQMTSEVESELRPIYSAFDILKNIFPSGSVTGAPKIKTMQIIRQLEQGPRRIYTGSIGFFSNQHSGVFNVAIRTLLIDKRKGSG